MWVSVYTEGFIRTGEGVVGMGMQDTVKKKSHSLEDTALVRTPPGMSQASEHRAQNHTLGAQLLQ